MQVKSGEGGDSQWFDYRPSYFSDPVRVEWDKDTMFAALPSDTAGFLLARGYARPMTKAEVEAYSEPAPAPVPAPKPRKKAPVEPEPEGDQP